MTQTNAINVQRNLFGHIVTVPQRREAVASPRTKSVKFDPWSKFFNGRSVPVFEDEGDDTKSQPDCRLYEVVGEDEKGKEILEIVDYKSDSEEYAPPSFEQEYGISFKAYKLLAKKLAGTALEGMIINRTTKCKAELAKIREYYDAYVLPYVDNSVQHDLSEIPLSPQVKEHFARLVYETKKVVPLVKVAEPEKDIKILVASDWAVYEEACKYAKVAREIIDQNRGLGAGMTRKKARLIYLAQPLADKHQMKQLCDLFKELVENAILPEMEYLLYSSAYLGVVEHDITSPDFKWSRESLGRIGLAASRAFRRETTKLCNFKSGIVEDFDTLASTNREIINSQFSEAELEKILANAGLTKTERLVLKSRYITGMSIKDSGEFLGKNTETVLKHSKNALKKLRDKKLPVLSARIKRCSDKRLEMYVDRLVEAMFGDDPSPNATPAPKAKTKVRTVAKGELHKYTAGGREYVYNPRPYVTKAEPVSSIVDNKAELDAYWTTIDPDKVYEPGCATPSKTQWLWGDDVVKYKNISAPVADADGITKQSINYARTAIHVDVNHPQEIVYGSGVIKPLDTEVFTYEPSPVWQPRKRSYICQTYQDAVRCCDCCES